MTKQVKPSISTVAIMPWPRSRLVQHYREVYVAMRGRLRVRSAGMALWELRIPGSAQRGACLKQGLLNYYRAIVLRGNTQSAS
jgi:hypothetical protein